MEDDPAPGAPRLRLPRPQLAKECALPSPGGGGFTRVRNLHLPGSSSEFSRGKYSSNLDHSSFVEVSPPFFKEGSTFVFCSVGMSESRNANAGGGCVDG
jgi:hypothetical protein